MKVVVNVHHVEKDLVGCGECWKGWQRVKRLKMNDTTARPTPMATAQPKLGATSNSASPMRTWRKTFKCSQPSPPRHKAKINDETGTVIRCMVRSRRAATRDSSSLKPDSPPAMSSCSSASNLSNLCCWNSSHKTTQTATPSKIQAEANRAKASPAPTPKRRAATPTDAEPVSLSSS